MICIIKLVFINAHMFTNVSILCTSNVLSCVAKHIVIVIVIVICGGTWSDHEPRATFVNQSKGYNLGLPDV